jgi:uncharacterized membrane protein
MSDENFTTPPPGPESSEQPATEPTNWGTPQPNYSQANYPPPPPPPPGYTQTTYPPPPQPGYVPPPVAGAGLSDTAASALAYITFIPAIIFLVLAPYNEKPMIKFHAYQELGLTIVLVCLHVIAIIPVLGWFIYVVGSIALLVVWILCIVKASQGGAFKLPLIGNFAAEQSGYRI